MAQEGETHEFDGDVKSYYFLAIRTPLSSHLRFVLFHAQSCYCAVLIVAYRLRQKKVVLVACQIVCHILPNTRFRNPPPLPPPPPFAFSGEVLPPSSPRCLDSPPKMAPASVLCSKPRRQVSSMFWSVCYAVLCLRQVLYFTHRRHIRVICSQAGSFISKVVTVGVVC